jgi:hypothetical protein
MTTAIGGGFLSFNKLFTFAVSYLYKHLYNGCPYCILDWKNHNEQYSDDIKIENNTINVSEKLGFTEFATMKSTKIFKLQDIKKIYNNNYIENDFNNLLIDNYYFACSSDKHTAKYFYLFIILECYENTDAFNELFEDKLFSEDEIDNLINSVMKKEAKNNIDRKRGIIKGLSKYTTKVRAEKLFEYLSSKELDIITNNFIRIDDIKNIIEQRNKLFHSSSKFSLELLYCKLFPLIKEILVNDLFAKSNGA